MRYLPGMQDWIVERTNVKAQLSYYKIDLVCSFVQIPFRQRRRPDQMLEWIEQFDKTDHGRDVDVLHFTHP